MQYLTSLATNYGIKVLWILFLFIVAKVVLRKIIHKIIDITTDDKSQDIQERADTLGGVLVITGNIIIYIIILLMILSLFGVNIAPILAGAGIVGLAVGFGSKSLVQDFVTGLFILIENQYAIGEKIMIDKKYEGVVQKITLRSTVLKDKDGNQVFVSNSQVKGIVNYSRS